MPASMLAGLSLPRSAISGTLSPGFGHWQVKDMRMSIMADQQRLVQWAEEKVALATTCADLLEWHSQKLTREIKAFDSELKVIHIPE